MGSGSESSDDECPEVVSSVTMKSDREKELREMFAQKQKAREQLKLKRKLKAEKLTMQKKEKKEKMQPQLPDDDDLAEESLTTVPDDLIQDSDNISPSISIPGDDQLGTDSEEKIKKPLNKKIYPKYNIVVEPLTKIQNPRAAAALSFKEKRLAKVPRENVASTLNSYREKIRVKNT